MYLSKYNTNEFIPLTREELFMNWTTYLKNVVKSRHNLITQNIQLSRYISDLHAQHAREIAEIRADNYKVEYDLRERIDDLRKQNKDCVENVLIHANEKRSLLNFIMKMKTKELKDEQTTP